MQRTAALGLLLIIGTGKLEPCANTRRPSGTPRTPEPMTACFAVPMATTASAQTRLLRPGGVVISPNALRIIFTSAFMASVALWWSRSRRPANVSLGSPAFAVSTSSTARRLTTRTRLFLPVSSQPSSSSSSSSPSSASVRIDQNSIAGRSGNGKKERKQLRSSTWRHRLAPGGLQPTTLKEGTATQSDGHAAHCAQPRAFGSRHMHSKDHNCVSRPYMGVREAAQRWTMNSVPGPVKAFPELIIWGG